MALWHSSNTRHPSNSSPPHQFTSCCRRLCLLPLKTPTNQQTNHQFRIEYLMYLKIYAGIIIPLYWTDINLKYMYKNSLSIWLICISDLQFHILIKYHRLKSTPPPLYKEKQNITFIPYIFVLWNYTWTVAYCGHSMQKTSDRRTWPMCSASGPMNHFLHQTRMSNVSVLCGPKNFCIDCVEPLKFAMTFHTQLIHHKQMIKQSVFIVWIVLQNFLSTYFSEITNL